LRGGLLRVDVWEGGRGEPLLFLHGEAGPRWTRYHDLLADRYRVVAPVIAGYGESSGSEQLQDIHDLIYWGLDLLDVLGLRSVPLIGHGLGGMLAAELAAVQPERFSRLVLIDAFGLWLPDAPTLDYFAATPGELSRALYHDQEAPAARAAAEAPAEGDAYIAFMLERAKSMASAARFLWPLPNRGLNRRLHRIAAPTQVVWGESDGIMSPLYGQALRDQIAGSSLELIDGAGHLPQEEQPDRVAEITLRFLAEAPGASAGQASVLAPTSAG